MTGLIRKDFLVMRKALKSYLLLVGFYIFLAYRDLFDYSCIITFVQVVLAVLPITAFAYDEQAKWDRYALGLAGTGLLYLVRQADPLEMFITLMVSSAIGLIIPAILLPLSYKLGAERARPYLYAIIFIPVVAVVLLARAGVLDVSLLKGMDLLAPAALAGSAANLPQGYLAGQFIAKL